MYQLQKLHVGRNFRAHHFQPCDALSTTECGTFSIMSDIQAGSVPPQSIHVERTQLAVRYFPPDKPETR